MCIYYVDFGYGNICLEDTRRPFYFIIIIPVHVGGQITVSFSFLCLYFVIASSLLSFSTNIVCRGAGTSSFKSSANDFSSSFGVVVSVS